MEISNKRKLQQIASNQFSHVVFQDFIKLYKDYTEEPFSFTSTDTTLPRKSKQSIKKSAKTKLNTV